ncbi:MULTISPECIES: sodium:phosphate symporter [Corynebacterium]|uniref:Sodium:phosphate symporter n=2 Tax=Corynebacterium glucuronolyticum TaxID=39791 RepID=A0A7T4EGV3_9CORY|nr:MULTISPECIES: sodium:phosphate symporter [Corynebacterium]EEI25995.1 hypothetical protein HMPREF0294_2460 [Corynebacterium glucuronolyticum ATCC 51867]EEI64131.1 hypothetical protein HMPREF0293_0218 [Corynebacterium glucuronolyticum ATCC 51866]MCT1442006.1 sodium:phosphate symporter [Corynebacterium glucuronolyticum]MCT1563518.1 sodium:phosphate symporter [Corynebacterium glucuronolyticum]OFO46276.1 sodium:phosphate symporter [Corynebacterium sp. HMSC073D01]
MPSSSAPIGTVQRRSTGQDVLFTPLGAGVRWAIILVATLALIGAISLMSMGLAPVAEHILVQGTLGTGIIAAAITQSSSFVTLMGSGAVVLGANLGTCFTAGVVAVVFRHSFLRASTAFFLHFWVNAVGVLLFIPFITELPTSDLHPIPPIHWVWSIVGLVLLYVAIRTITVQLRVLMSAGQTGHVGFWVGFFLASILQSSTAITAAAVPMAAVRAVSARRLLRLISGTNLGTCTTAWLFVARTGNSEGATLHLVFNLVMVALVALFPDVFLALARTCARHSTPLRLVIFLAVMFFALPLASMFLV